MFQSTTNNTPLTRDNTFNKLLRLFSRPDTEITPAAKAALMANIDELKGGTRSLHTIASFMKTSQRIINQARHNVTIDTNTVDLTEGDRRILNALPSHYDKINILFYRLHIAINHYLTILQAISEPYWQAHLASAFTNVMRAFETLFKQRELFVTQHNVIAIRFLQEYRLKSLTLMSTVDDAELPRDVRALLDEQQQRIQGIVPHRIFHRLRANFNEDRQPHQAEALTAKPSMLSA